MEGRRWVLKVFAMRIDGIRRRSFSKSPNFAAILCIKPSTSLPLHRRARDGSNGLEEEDWV
jgi:hypothetical protein